MNHAIEPRWKSYLILMIAIASTLLLLCMKPIPQPQDYHHFADNRTFLGVPNALNVMSNLFFLLVGLMGLWQCFRNSGIGNRVVWAITFVGVMLVSVGSSYYHWKPDDQTLVWDRLPMTIAFMAFLSAILGEYLGAKIARIVLIPALLLGVASVIYWHATNDLRWYAWVVFTPLLIIIALLILYKSVHRRALMLMLVFYVAAKLAEEFDVSIYTALGSIISGHSLKHIFAAVACYWMVAIVRQGSRQPVLT